MSLLTSATCAVTLCLIPQAYTVLENSPDTRPQWTNEDYTNKGITLVDTSTEVTPETDLWYLSSIEQKVMKAALLRSVVLIDG